MATFQSFPPGIDQARNISRTTNMIFSFLRYFESLTENPRREAWKAMEDHPRKRRIRRFSSLLQLLQEFCGYTSCGGLGRIVGTKFLVFKVLWVMLFLAAVGMVINQLIPLFYKYRSRPISTKMSLQFNGVSLYYTAKTQYCHSFC